MSLGQNKRVYNDGVSSTQEPYQIDIKGIHNYMDMVHAIRSGGVETIDSTIGIYNTVIVGSESLASDSNCCIIGYQGHTTGKNQIVFAAGNNNQLRFNEHGVTFNDEVLTDNTKITECLLDILQKIKYFELI